MGDYYKAEHLPDFGSIAEGEPELARKFFDYYGAVFADGALSAREKALIALNNLPIARFLEWLEASANLQSYMELLVNAFNPATVGKLMCSNTISVSWDDRVFDCDFNQMLELGVTGPGGGTLHIRDFDPKRWATRAIRTARHCFGCAAGDGSSCGGGLVEE